MIRRKMIKKMTKRRRKERSQRDSLFHVTITGHLVQVGVHMLQVGMVKDGEHHFGTSLKRHQLLACHDKEHVYLLTCNYYFLESIRNTYYYQTQFNVNKKICKNLEIFRGLSSNFRLNRPHYHFL